MIKSEYGYYTLELNGEKVELNESGGTSRPLADFDLKKVIEELGLPDSCNQTVLNNAQREWNRITDTQLRDLKVKVEKLESESYKQQDVDDIDGKLAVTMRKVDANQNSISEIKELLCSGREVTVHSRLSDMEENLNELRSRFARLEGWQVVSKKIADLERCTLQMAKTIDANSENVSSNVAEDRRRLTRLEESNEQRKKDIKHAWNLCEETQKEMAVHRSNTLNIGDALNTHLRKCAQVTCTYPCSSCDAKLKRMEECCKNTVASGKELERKFDSVEGILQGHASNLKSHESDICTLTKQADRAKKFMDKLHDI